MSECDNSVATFRRVLNGEQVEAKVLGERLA